MKLPRGVLKALIEPPATARGWNEVDMAALRCAYPLGGVRAVQEELRAHGRPVKSSEVIRKRASDLGIRCRRGRPYGG